MTRADALRCSGALLALVVATGCGRCREPAGNRADPPAASGAVSDAGAAAVPRTPPPPITPLTLAEGARYVLGAAGPRHAREVAMVAFSPEGHHLASVANDRHVFEWDVATGVPFAQYTSSDTYPPFVGYAGSKVVAALPGGMHEVRRGGNGRWLLVDDKGAAVLYEIATGRRVPYTGPEVEAFSIAGGTLAAVIEKRQVAVGPLGGALKPIASTAKEPAYTALLSPDASQVALFGEDGTLRVQPLHASATAGAQRVIAIPGLPRAQSGATAFAWAPGGETLALVVDGEELGLVDLRSGRYRALATDAFGNDINTIAYAPDGRTIAGGTSYGLVRIWNAQSGALLHEHGGHIGTAWGAAISDDGKTIASAGDERALVWTPESTTAPAAYADHEHWVTHTALSADGKLLASCSDYGDINVRRLPGGKRIARLQSRGGSCESLDIRGGRVILGDGKHAQLFALRDGARPTVVPMAAGVKWGSSAFAVTRDGSRVASGGDDGRLAVHALPSGAMRWRVDMPALSEDDEEPGVERYEVVALAFDPTGRHLAVYTGDDVLRVRDARTGRVVRTLPLPDPSAGVTSLAYAGAHLAVGRPSGQLLVLDARGTVVLDVRHRHGGIHGLAANRSRIVAGGADGSLTVWDLP